ncbi:helicase associated domain-containing protein, partial [Planktotalea frisia]
GFSKLLQFREAEGHCNVPIHFKLGGYGLGNWVRTQRSRTDRLSPERKQRLDDIGFIWDPLIVAWEEGFNKLLEFKEREGDCRVPNKHKEGGFNLGSWVGTQRRNKDSISPERKQRLGETGFVWGQLAKAWEEGFNKLLQFKEANGHCRVPNLFKLDGFNLGSWVGVQRRNKDSLSSEQKQRLDALGFIWDAYTEKWEEGFSKLQQFKEREGDCRVPRAYQLDGFRLGRWVGVQRNTKDSMSPERRQRLDDIGFVWDTLTEAWEEGFSKLSQFKEAEGHCRVRLRATISGFNLGKWVSWQRTTKDSMSAERRQRLDDIGFVWDASKGKT